MTILLRTQPPVVGAPVRDARRRRARRRPGRGSASAADRPARRTAGRLRARHARLGRAGGRGTAAAVRPALGVVLLRERLDMETMAQALRAGVREAVDAHDVDAVRTACSPFAGGVPAADRQRRARGGTAAEAKIVTVFSAKGGCGKSTLATNLAVCLAEGGGERVCLVDLDLAFGDVGIMLQLCPDRGIADAVASSGPDRRRAGPGAADAVRARGGRVARAGRAAPRRSGSTGSSSSRCSPPSAPWPTTWSSTRRRTSPRACWPRSTSPTSRPGRHARHAGAEEPADRHGHARPARAQQGQAGWSCSTAATRRWGSPAPTSSGCSRRRTTGHIPSSRDVPISINRGTPIVVDKPGHPVSKAIRDLAAGPVAQHAGTAARAGSARRAGGR